MTTDTPKLYEAAAELRAAIMTSLGFNPDKPQAPDDARAQRQQNELRAINKQIEDAEAGAQSDARTTFMAAQHDALVVHEVTGFTLTVKYAQDKDGKETTSIAYTPTDATIDAIKAALITDRPSSVHQFTYGRDDNGEHSFDFGKGATRPASNGNRTAGWIKDGTTGTLADAFKATATKAQQAEHDAIKGDTSKQYALKVKVVKDNGYVKATS